MERERALKLIEALGDEYGDSATTVYDPRVLAEAAGMHPDTLLPLVDLYDESVGFVGNGGAKETVVVAGLSVLNWIAERLGLDVECQALGRCRNARAIIGAIHEHFGVLA